MLEHTHRLNPDTQAVLLLCGRFGKQEAGEVKPLSQGEYDRLAEWLVQHGMRPSTLLAPDGPDALRNAGLSLPVEADRLLILLDRGGALAMAVESWSNKGLWVISRSDEAYPRPLRTGRVGPPLLYGAGDAHLLSQGGLAVIGSRDVDAEGLEFTRKVARTCAEQGIVLVSGGARGVDTEAMLAALNAGGTALGVLGDSLARVALSGAYRQPLLEERLVLISPYYPESGFDVGNAMARNKHIYALADWALVVSSTEKKGGTWAGAVEALKAGKTAVFARTEGHVPEGNRELLKIGALPFPAEPWVDLAYTLSEAATSAEEAPVAAGQALQGQFISEPLAPPYTVDPSQIAPVKPVHDKID